MKPWRCTCKAHRISILPEPINNQFLAFTYLRCQTYGYLWKWRSRAIFLWGHESWTWRGLGWNAPGARFDVPSWRGSGLSRRGVILLICNHRRQWLILWWEWDNGRKCWSAWCAPRGAWKSGTPARWACIRWLCTCLALGMTTAKKNISYLYCKFHLSLRLGLTFCAARNYIILFSPSSTRNNICFFTHSVVLKF